MHNLLEKIGIKDYLDELEEKRKVEKAFQASYKAMTHTEFSTTSSTLLPSILSISIEPSKDN